MTKLKTIYDELVPEVKETLVNDIVTYSDLNSYELSAYSFMYGHQIIQK